MEEYVASKKKNEKEMIDILKKEIQDERKKVDNLRNKREYLEGQIQIKRDEEREEEAIRAKTDNKLIEDRLRVLELNIQRVNAAILKE